MQTEKTSPKFKETVTFLRNCNPAKDFPKNGFIYLHRWATGFQELVFSSNREAKDFEKKVNSL